MKLNLIPILSLLILPLISFADEGTEKWNGLYRGVYSFVSANGEKTKPQPFVLEIGRTGSEGFVRLNFSEGSGELQVSIVNLHQRKENSPPKITDDTFYLAPIFAEPTEFEATMKKGGFDENILQGKIVTYSLSVDSDPVEEMHIEFKAGTLRK